jgi:hypothetical protein
MASNTGIAIIDFGPLPYSGDAASVTVIDAVPLGTTNVYAEAWMNVDDNVTGYSLVPGTNHTHYDHYNLSMFVNLQCLLMSGTDLYIAIQSIHKFSGTFAVNWAWSDGV